MHLGYVTHVRQVEVWSLVDSVSQAVHNMPATPGATALPHLPAAQTLPPLCRIMSFMVRPGMAGVADLRRGSETLLWCAWYTYMPHNGVVDSAREVTNLNHLRSCSLQETQANIPRSHLGVLL